MTQVGLVWGRPQQEANTRIRKVSDFKNAVHGANDVTYQDSNYDVVVVGYGPAGEVLASTIGAAGFRVLVVERWPQPYPLPRLIAATRSRVSAQHRSDVADQPA
ncbi:MULTISPECIES: FAD-dependent monooxygenase [Pseudomonas]|uniref:FAD-dependent monooxygenase n=1 Tax=Pseudomonas TaxID=286 RepID=UPI0011AED0D9